MPLVKLQFRPGVNRDQTNYSNEGGWFECDKIRFRSGFPQKLGGWLKYSFSTLVGACREMWNYVTSFNENFLALGTNIKAYIEVGGTLYDITPLRETTPAGAVTFSAVVIAPFSSTITVTDAGHGATAGDYVTFSGAVSLGGNITAAVLNQEYVVVSVISVNQYTIIAKSSTTGLPVTSNASDTGTGGAAVVAAYQISTGYAGGTYGYGWGTGTWSRGTWSSGSTSPINLAQTDWSITNFDNDLVLNRRTGSRGPIYYWARGIITDPSTALATRAVLLSTVSGATDVPTEVGQIIVSQNDKHLIGFGCTPYGGGTFDPLLIRWANQDNPENWTPTPTNTAGFLRVSRGSYIVQAIPTRQEILVITDSSVYSLQFIGTTDVFSLQELSDNISIASYRAASSVNNVTYWMGLDKFYAYAGRVETLPCTLRNHVFNNLNYDQLSQIVSGTNEGFHEVWWFYPTATSNFLDAYVIYNYLEKIWYYGTIERTAWIDSSLRQYPQAVGAIRMSCSISGTTLTVNSTNSNSLSLGSVVYGDGIQNGTYITALGTGTGGVGTYTLSQSYSLPSVVVFSNGVIFNHEQGINDDVGPMVSYITSSDYDIQDGDQFMLTRRLIPDVDFTSSTASTPSVDMTIYPRSFPGAPVNTNPTITQPVIRTSVTQYTNQVYIRARARQLAVKIGSSALGVQWQLGSPRVDARADGRR